MEDIFEALEVIESAQLLPNDEHLLRTSVAFSLTRRRLGAGPEEAAKTRCYHSKTTLIALATKVNRDVQVPKRLEAAVREREKDSCCVTGQKKNLQATYIVPPSVLGDEDLRPDWRILRLLRSARVFLLQACVRIIPVSLRLALYRRARRSSVTLLPLGLCLKAVRQPTMHNEANALRMVERYTNVSAPRLIDFVTEDSTGFVLMTQAPGGPAGSSSLLDDHLANQIVNALGAPLYSLYNEDLKSYFTHSDLHQSNIFVERGRLHASSTPEYWEYIKALWPNLTRKSQQEILAETFEENYEQQPEAEMYLWQVKPVYQASW
ncbi:hypothetical protein VTO42DRAFT_715 [Malbranchea cinnamomea]